MSQPNPKVPIKLVRDCEVVQIPEGYSVRLARGTTVTVLQTLGGMFTVMTEYGTMVRIADKDADAIGLQVVTPSTAPEELLARPLTEEETKERMWHQLRSVYDPEIPVNVVELGLVYELILTPAEANKFNASVKMTLTAPGCGMGNVLKDDAERKIKTIPSIQDANVEIVLDPPWSPDKMSEAAKLELGFA